MHKEHLILCGKTEAARPSDAEVHKLELGKGMGKISIDVDAITAKMVQDLPSVLHDLLEIAAYVYVGDQAISRGGLKSFEYGEDWHRCLYFKIPVREYEIWSDPNAKELLEEAMSFVSGDTYTFNFVSQPVAKFPEFLNFRTERNPELQCDEIVLLSGGLDSFTGAIEEVVGNKKLPVFVSHRSNNKMASFQQRLYEYITDLYESGPKPLHVPVTINKDRRLTRETSQRSRSFLYASIGTIMARMFRLNRVRFYENGIASCNLPFDGQTLQARSTRVTHPKFLSLLSELLSVILDSEFHLENPYFFKTRTEICLRLKELHHETQICETRSCAKSIYMRPYTHCGTCLQCIDRRFATLASECDKNDREQLYVINIFTDALSAARDRAMAAGFADFATRIERMTIEDFVSIYTSEVSEITRYIPVVSREEATRAVFSLYSRHAQKVNGVLEAAINEHRASIRKGTLPDTCLVSMVARKEHLDVKKLMAKRAETGKKHAKGELEKKVRNLLEQDPYLSAEEIAQKIDNSTADAIRHTKAWKEKHRKK